MVKWTLSWKFFVTFLSEICVIIVYFALFQDRSLWLQWVQDLPGPWPNSCEARWQGKSNVLKSWNHFQIWRNVFLDFYIFFLKVYKFLDGRTMKAHLLKRNPRKVTWTVLYRRKHKKGIEEEAAKKRTKRTQKFQRAVVGATLQDIMAKRNQKPEVRKAQREQAIR